MIKKLVFVLLAFGILPVLNAQNKIGGTVGPSNSNAFLELGDATGSVKGLLLPRVSLQQTNLPNPLTAHVKGMLVYNVTTNGTDKPDVTEGIYYNDGTQWIKLITTAGTGSAGTLTDANNGLAVAGGNTVQLGGSLNQPTVLTASAANTLSVMGLQLGNSSDSLIVSDPSGVLRKISFSQLIQNLQVTNGLTYNAATRTIMLGGTLTQPVIINTDATNTLSLKGLTAGSLTDRIMVVDPITGQLKSLDAQSLAGTRQVRIYTAADGQTSFDTPFTISNIDKVQVFRNGVEMDFQANVGDNTLTLDFSTYSDGYYTSCFAGDEVKIFQWK
jgi:hypothetical protein